MNRHVIVPGPGEIPAVAAVGGKAHNLARLAAVPGVTVPPWFVIGASAFDALVLDGATTLEDAPQRVAALALPASLATELQEALAARGLARATLAVRSSATAEDAAAASFAGQFTTVLGVPADDPAALWDAVKTVWGSAFSAHALAYARDQRAEGALRMAVLVQALAPARAAGVAFSVDPVTADQEVAVVSAVYGLGETLVGGDADADTFRVRFDADAPRVASELAEKHEALLPGGRRIAVPSDLARAPAISEAQAIAIGRVARTLAQSLGGPQDVEWAVGTPGAPAGVAAPAADETLFVLQTRPVTAVAGARQGERRLWDNSNIIESYSGVTTPLTFSFARAVYEQVYIQFCRLLGVPEAQIRAHREVFANMLGLIDGRVYYNLLNWYRVLALLPGYALNREFMERMMGVRERLADPPVPPGAGERSRDALRLVGMSGRLLREHRRLDGEVAAFFRRVDRALAPIEGTNIDTWSADELVALYRRLEAELLLHWRPPLVNDFFAMIWFGVLGRLVARWLPDAPPTLVNDLLVGEGGIVSTEPARRVMALAALASADPALRALFTGDADDAAVLHAVRSEPAHAALARELDAYLGRFGDRCIGELKLETITQSEDPGFLVGVIRAYVAQGRTDPDAGGAHEAAVRAGAEHVVRERLRGARLRAFLRVLGHTRARIRDRENLRFERTRVFGAVRRIFRALGHRLHERGRLTDPRDVFHLTTDEVFAAVAGTGVTQDLAALAALRREEFARFERQPAPPDRFETWGPPAAPPAGRAEGVLAEGDLQGMGCCPGLVRAPVRVVRDPTRAPGLAGHILVAERTDPGWTLLFPTASGLLVQRGSLLSHSAIVAREIGLPCVVAIPGLMDRLVDGEWVEMDGTSGRVRRIPAPAREATA